MDAGRYTRFAAFLAEQKLIKKALNAEAYTSHSSVMF